MMTCLTHYTTQAQNKNKLERRQASQQSVTHTWTSEKECEQALSLLIVDLKFDGTHIKICELGEALESRFQGYDQLYGKGAMWSNIWISLTSMHEPLYVVEKDFWARNQHEYGFQTLKDYKGALYRSIQSVENDRAVSWSITRSPQKHLGILVCPSLGTQNEYVQKIRSQYPQFTHVDAHTNKYIRTKDSQLKLFKDAGAGLFKPKTRLYKKAYTTTISQTVAHDFKESNVVVIKPTNGSLGYGVIMTAWKDIDQTLRMIISQKQQLKKFGDNPSYTYWTRDTNSEFIVEAYAPSKPIIVDNNSYDATMRVVCLLGAHHKNRFATYIGSYWKLPEKALGSKAHLTDIHKSHIIADSTRPSSARVESTDYAVVQKELTSCFQLLTRVFFERN